MGRCEKAGVSVRRYLLPRDCAGEQLMGMLEEINADGSIHGCLLLRPLEDRGLEEAACALLDPRKDVDGMTRASLAGVFARTGEGYPPCTAQACVELLDHYGVEPAGKRVAVVGRSLVVGRPLAMLLQARDATVTMCHSRTADLPSVCREAEILIAAAGSAGLIGPGCVSPGQIVLDVGVNAGPDGALVGDVDFAAVEPVAGAVTPVPGGVGAVTAAVLAKHVVAAAERAAGLP